MKKSTINFEIVLDEANVPESIQWNASDKTDSGFEDTPAIAVSIWDSEQRNTMRMDLWTKKMTTLDMKRLCVDSIGGMADTIRGATSDNVMSDKMEELCRELVKHIESLTKEGQH